jgi:hypothetical protein
MRKALRIFWITFLSLFSADVFIGFIDWLARWDWLESLMLGHPRMASFIKTPFSSLVLLVLGFAFLAAEKRLKEPRIEARYINSRIVPDLHSTTMNVMFDSDMKTPGWDEHKLDWDWFVEVQLANSAETPTTIDSLKHEIFVGSRWNRQVIRTQYFEDLDKFDMDMGLDRQGNHHGKRHAGSRYQPVPSLMDKIINTPLNQEVGYRGWLHFKVFQVNQRDMNSGKIRINIWLIDAMQRKHEIHFRKKDEQSWDNSFYISPVVKSL